MPKPIETESVSAIARSEGIYRTIEKALQPLDASQSPKDLLSQIAKQWGALFSHGAVFLTDLKGHEALLLQTDEEKWVIESFLFQSASLNLPTREKIGEVLATGNASFDGHPDAPASSENNPVFFPSSYCLIVPLSIGPSVVGALCAGTASGEPPLTSQDFEIARLFALLASRILTGSYRNDSERRRHAESDAQYRLQEITRAISQTLDLRTVLRMVRDAVVDASGFDRAGVFLVEPKTGLIRGIWGTDMQGKLEDISHQIYDKDSPTPFGDLIRHKISYSIAAEDAEGAYVRACLPLSAGGEVMGILAVDNFITHHPLSEADIERLRPFCDGAAIAIRNARLHERLRREVQSLRTLQEISNEVRASMDPEQVLKTLVQRSGELSQAAECSIFLADGEDRLNWHCGFGLKDGEIIPLERGIAPAITRSLSPTLFRSHDRQKPLEIRSPDDPQLTEDESASARQMGISTAAVLPLCTSQECYGVLMLIHYTEPRVLLAEELALLQSLADQGAVALQKARYLEEARLALSRTNEINNNLRRAFVPQLPSNAPGLEIGHRFEPASREVRLGGDFYDLFRLGRHRYGVVMGDVAGHGMDAAVQTAAAKYLLRAFAEKTPKPEAVVSRLNQALLQQFSTPSFVSLFYGILDLKAGTLTYSNAGHEPPHLLLPSEGQSPANSHRVSQLDETYPLLAVKEDVLYSSHAVEFPVGARLVLYTDGLTEARKEGEFLLTEGVTKVLVENLAHPPQAMADRVWDAVKTYADHLHDDVALLILQRTH